MGLVRMQVKLDAEERERLTQEASRRGMSTSAFLREMVREGLAAARRRPIDLKKAMAIVGAGRSGARDVSVRHDDYLAGKRQ
ncbi:MAG: ribbon-helix-helix protein, CopG family [Armatimonadetes bacterium]|nr:ribbon-helix-helix protein, CopG family [Armatimonadota bacterium]